MLRHWITTGVLFALVSTSALAAVDRSQLEVLQAQASMYYHAQKYDECLKTLDRLLAKDPNHVEAYELAALTHRKKKNNTAAERLYARLLKIAPKHKRAAYHFELATIQYKEKKFKEAHAHFEKAVWGRFNPGTSHFFLGIMDFNAKDWRAARNNLTASLTYSDAKSMTPVTRYYLANTYAQLGRTDAAVQNFHATTVAVEDAKTQSGGAPDSLIGDIRNNAIKELKNMNRGSRFFNVSLLSQYDTNVQTNPLTANDAETTATRKSAKGVLSLSAGMNTSPTKPVQATASYRYFTNYNLNHLARDFNFMSHTGNVMAMYKPYGRLSGGIKTEFTFSMKNNLLSDSSPRDLRYRPFSSVLDLGPIAKFELTPRILLTGEALWRPKWYYLDPPSGDSRRTGGGVFGRLTAEFLTLSDWVNPMTYVSFEWDHPRGKTFRMYTWAGGVSNPLKVTEKLTLTPSLDISQADYYAIRTQKRDDVFMSYRLAGSYVLPKGLMLIGDVGYMKNKSTISSSFTYNRVVASGGVSYSF